MAQVRLRLSNEEQYRRTVCKFSCSVYNVARQFEFPLLYMHYHSLRVNCHCALSRFKLQLTVRSAPDAKRVRLVSAQCLGDHFIRLHCTQ